MSTKDENRQKVDSGRQKRRERGNFVSTMDEIESGQMSTEKTRTRNSLSTQVEIDGKSTEVDRRDENEETSCQLKTRIDRKSTEKTRKRTLLVNKGRE